MKPVLTILAMFCLCCCQTAPRLPSSDDNETPPPQSDYVLSPDYPIPQAEYKLSKWQDLEISVLSDRQIRNIFQALAHSTLPFGYAGDCCQDRAYKMAWWLDQAGIISIKVFVQQKDGLLHYGSSNNDTEGMSKSSDTEGNWFFHVAPAVKNSNGQLIILDPSTSDKPLEVSAWQTLFVPDNIDVEVNFAARFYYQPGFLHYDLRTWDDNYLDPKNGIVELSLLGCKAVQENRKKQKASSH
jgi:hypothetical protein